MCWAICLIRSGPPLVPLNTPQSIRTNTGRSAAASTPLAFFRGKQSRKQSPRPVRYMRTVTPDFGGRIRRSPAGSANSSSRLTLADGFGESFFAPLLAPFAGESFPLGWDDGVFGLLACFVLTVVFFALAIDLTPWCDEVQIRTRGGASRTARERRDPARRRRSCRRPKPRRRARNVCAARGGPATRCPSRSRSGPAHSRRRSAGCNRR